jgi:hypothetical protein
VSYGHHGAVSGTSLKERRVFSGYDELKPRCAMITGLPVEHRLLILHFQLKAFALGQKGKSVTTCFEFLTEL